MFMPSNISIEQAALYNTIGKRTRTCARCGRDFYGPGRPFACDHCKKPRGRKPSIGLTAREKQVVALVRMGKANKTIAEELNLTEGTIKIYVSEIFRKAGVSNRTELALWGLSQDLGPGVNP